MFPSSKISPLSVSALMDRTKSVVFTTGTLGIGMSIAACQIGLYVGAATTNLCLDGLITTTNISKAVVSKGLVISRGVESQIQIIIKTINEYAKELRKMIEQGAIEAITTPGDVILRIIRNFSAKLNEQLGKLRDKGAKLLSNAVLNRVQLAIDYVEKLDQNLAKAQSINQVNVQVFEEAKNKLTDVAQWSSSLLSTVNKAAKRGRN